MSTKKPPEPDGPRFLTDAPIDAPVARGPVLVPAPASPVAPAIPMTPTPSTASGKPCALFGVAVSDKDRLICVAHDNGTVGFWQPVFAEKLGIAAPWLAGQGHARGVRAIAYEPPGARDYDCFVSGGIDGTIRAWHVGDRTQNATFRHHDSTVMSLAFDRARTRLVSGSEDQTVAIASWPDMRVEKKLVGHAATVLSVAVSPDGAHIATGDAEGIIWIWTIRGERVAQLEVSAKFARVFPAVWGLQFIDRDRIAFTHAHRVFVWTAKVGSTVLYEDRDPIYPLHGLALRADGGEITVGRRDEIISIPLADPRARRVRTGHEADVNGVAYLGDGRIASTGDDGALLVWGDGDEPALRLRAGG